MGKPTLRKSHPNGSRLGQSEYKNRENLWGLCIYAGLSFL
ncbi:MAG: hypothetical protein JWP00_4991 [Chloroflexi bacterium]|jgi:hypothetical protein|nr:hypothetical protein [Chloroflexota bacterium]